jgi:hypothetical protein
MPMKEFKFRGLQKLHAAYTDKRLDVEGEIMRKYVGDFDFNDDYVD